MFILNFLEEELLQNRVHIFLNLDSYLSTIKGKLFLYLYMHIEIIPMASDFLQKGAFFR